MNKTFVLLPAGVVLASIVVAAGGPPSRATDYPAQIQFQDRPGDAITSDGKGAYRNGVEGVTAVFQVNADGTGNNFLLKFAPVKGKMVRSVRYAYGSPVATSCNGTPGDNPTGVQSDSGYVAFLNIASMATGATIAKQGGFHATFGTFRFHDVTKTDPIEPYNCGDLLIVTRLNQTMWTVTTDTTPGQIYVNTAGIPIYGSDPEQAGSIAQFDHDASRTFDGNYRMPFFATISCLGTSCPTPR